MPVAFTMRLDDQLVATIDAEASRLDRSRSWMIARALEQVFRAPQSLSQGFSEPARPAWTGQSTAEAPTSTYLASLTDLLTEWNDPADHAAFDDL